MGLINLLPCALCQLPPETRVLPDWLLFAGERGRVRVEGGRGGEGEGRSWIEVVLCLLRNGHGSQVSRATVLPTAPHRLGPGLQRHMWHLETFLCLESPICSLKEAATQRLNFPLLLYKEQSLVLKSPNKLLLSQTHTLTPNVWFYCVFYQKSLARRAESHTVFYQSPPPFPQAPVTRNTAAAPSPPVAWLRLREPRRMVTPPGSYLHCVKGRRAENNLALMQMLIQ